MQGPLWLHNAVCAPDIVAALSAHARTVQRHKVLASTMTLLMVAQTGITPALEWLLNFRSGHDAGKLPRKKLLTVLAQKGCGRVLAWLLRKKIFTKKFCRRMPRDVIHTAHPAVLEWIKSRGRFSPEEIRAGLPSMLSAGPGVQADIIEWLWRQPGVLTIEDFTSERLQKYMSNRRLDLLDSLIQRGADPAAWNPLVLMTAAYDVEGGVEWYAARAPVADILERQGAVWPGPDACWELMRAPGTGPYLLWAAACWKVFDKKPTRMWPKVPRDLLTRDNCMAHNGRALLAVNPRFRCYIARSCRLTPSDFASVGLPWPGAPSAPRS
jgi:hypothetical protein